MRIKIFILFVFCVGTFCACNTSDKSPSSGDNPTSMKDHIFVGTYTKTEGHVDGKGAGIYLIEFDAASGSMKLKDSTGGIINPSFLELSSNRKFLYAVNETGADVGEQGSVSAFRIEKDLSLSFLNNVGTGSHYPCHISLEGKDRFAYATNYVNGVVACFAIASDGKLSKAEPVFTFQGNGPHPRQEASHPHSINPSPDNSFALVCDLGTDLITALKIDHATGTLFETSIEPLQMEAGSGPRHLAFHAEDSLVFVLNELNNTISVSKMDFSSGKLEKISKHSTLPKDFSGESLAADVHIHPNKKYLYASNRGHNSIACFSIDPETGRLSLIGHTSTNGEVPRNFMIHSSGNWLLVANQNSDNIVNFSINSNGTLSYLNELSVPTPVCLKQY